MLVSLPTALLLLALVLLLPTGTDAGALPLAFFRHLQRLPYFGHGAGSRYDGSSGAASKLLSDKTAPAPPQPPRAPQQPPEAGIRPLRPTEEAKAKSKVKQERQRGQYQQPQQQQSASKVGKSPTEGAKIIVPPPPMVVSGANASAVSSAHPHVHHWGLRGDGYHAVMTGAYVCLV